MFTVPVLLPMLYLWRYFVLLLLDPRSPHLQISIAEYPDDHVIPVGYDVTIVCTSNISALVYRVAKIYLQIYWMSIYFYDNKITACGGTEADREDSKTCKFVIKNSTAKDAGLYFCQAHNDLSCTETSINLTFQGKQPVLKTISEGVLSGRATTFHC